MKKSPEISSLINYWEDQLSKWQKEYRLFGPQGEIEKHQTGLLKRDLNGLKSRIKKLYSCQKQLDSIIEELENYRQQV